MQFKWLKNQQQKNEWEQEVKTYSIRFWRLVFWENFATMHCCLVSLQISTKGIWYDTLVLEFFKYTFCGKMNGEKMSTKDHQCFYFFPKKRCKMDRVHSFLFYKCASHEALNSIIGTWRRPPLTLNVFLKDILFST